MASYEIRFTCEGSNIKTLKNLVKKHFKAEANITKYESKSRADRLGDAEASVNDAKSEVECLKDELQSWFDNLPENFQSGDKGSELEEAVSNLEEIEQALDSVDFSTVSFPSMY